MRVLFTGYLVTVSVGLMTAGGQILMTHGMADGKFGLSVDDIIYSYYGNRENSKLESKLHGTMKDKANTQERARIIKWVRQGSPESGWDSDIAPIFSKNCVQCHGAIPGLPPFTTYEEVKEAAAIDEGASVADLTRFSHIHLFGISFIFFFVGIIFSLSIRIPPMLKALAIGMPFLWLLVDFVSWWATKWIPSFAYLTMVGGFGYNVSAVFMILTSLYQMWVWPLQGKQFDDNAWSRD